MSVATCGICYFEYNVDGNRPVVGKCGHTVCSVCSSKFEDSQCPHCRKPFAFINPPTNFTVLHHLQNKGRSPRKVSNPSITGSCGHRFCFKCSLQFQEGHCPNCGRMNAFREPSAPVEHHSIYGQKISEEAVYSIPLTTPVKSKEVRINIESEIKRARSLRERAATLSRKEQEEVSFRGRDDYDLPRPVDEYRYSRTLPRNFEHRRTATFQQNNRSFRQVIRHNSVRVPQQPQNLSSTLQYDALPNVIPTSSSSNENQLSQSSPDGQWSSSWPSQCLLKDSQKRNEAIRRFDKILRIVNITLLAIGSILLVVILLSFLVTVIFN